VLAGEPTVTCILFVYNQEKYIRDAVKSILEQDYPYPVEIIISDDCSPDNTFEIVESLVQKYDGPFNVRLNRNDKNMGITPHVNKLVEMASGELLVMFPGDDIAMPDFISSIVDHWRNNGQPSVISGPSILIDADGNHTGEFGNVPYRDFSLESVVRRGTAWVFTVCVAKKVFDVFGPLPESIRNEDQLLPFRGVLLDGIGFIERPIRYYRRHGANFTFSVQMLNTSSFEEWINIYAGDLENRIKNFKCWQKDMQIAEEWLGSEKAIWAQQLIENHITRLQLELDHGIKPTLKTRVRLIGHMVRFKQISKRNFVMVLSPKLRYLFKV